MMKETIFSVLSFLNTKGESFIEHILNLNQELNGQNIEIIFVVVDPGITPVPFKRVQMP